MGAVISKLSGIGEEIPEDTLESIDGGVFLLPWPFYVGLPPFFRFMA